MKQTKQPVCTIKQSIYLDGYGSILPFKWFKLQTEQQQIVDAHNTLRRKIAKGQETAGANGSGPQPKAADMYQLSWDPVLVAKI
jgi:hypothetical protein